MDIEDQFELGHLFLAQRTCRSCGQTKDLLDGFYLTRKSRAVCHLHIHMNVKCVLLIGLLREDVLQETIHVGNILTGKGFMCCFPSEKGQNSKY